MRAPCVRENEPMYPYIGQTPGLDSSVLDPSLSERCGFVQHRACVEDFQELANVNCLPHPYIPLCSIATCTLHTTYTYT